MAFSECYTNFSTGANVNGGSDAGSPSMSDVAGTGSWSSATDQYISVATNGAVAVGQYLSIYSGAATVAAYTARITAVSGGGGSVWTITLSATAFSGVEPTTGATYKAQVGGAWKGSNAAEGFPFGYVTNALTNAAADQVCVNLKNTATYAITATMTQPAPNVMFAGYTTTVRDGGLAIIDGGTSGASYVLLTHSGTDHSLSSLIFQNNGATGSAAGVVISGARGIVDNCVFNSLRGHGLSQTAGPFSVSESHAYACNQSNTVSTHGFHANLTTSGRYVRCGSRGNFRAGFSLMGTGSYVMEKCHSASNSTQGIVLGGDGPCTISQCGVYSNVTDGILANTGSLAHVYIENTNLVKNGGYGINLAGGLRRGYIRNCGYGSGTQANTSGNTNALSVVIESGSIIYPTDLTPWVDPVNGDFRINLAAARGTGRGAFTQTEPGYGGTVGYPDIGAADAQPNVLIAGGMVGGMRA